MSKIGIGIIGTGSIVNTYFNCISELEEVELIALYSQSGNRKRELEDKFGVPIFDNLETFLALPEIDLVCVCNESGRHGRAIKSSAMARKHILCEKPLEVTPEKIDEVISVCTEQNVKLGCVFQNRCSSAYQSIVDTINSGKLGKLLMGNAYINWYRSEEYYVNSDWRGTKEFDGGAAFINQGIHTIDLLLHVMGSVKSVYGTVQTRVHTIEGEDVGTAILTFSNGALGNITGGTALYPGYPERLEIYGEKGSIIMQGGEISDWNVKDTPAPKLGLAKDQGSGSADPTAIGHLNHKKVLADMVEAIHKDRSPMVDGPEARKSVEVITAIYESSSKGELIHL